MLSVLLRCNTNIIIINIVTQSEAYKNYIVI